MASEARPGEAGRQAGRLKLKLGSAPLCHLTHTAAKLTSSYETPK